MPAGDLEISLENSFNLNSFGKVATTRGDTKKQENDIRGLYKSEDIVKSLLFMISNNIAQIGMFNLKKKKITKKKKRLPQC